MHRQEAPSVLSWRQRIVLWTKLVPGRWYRANVSLCPLGILSKHDREPEVNVPVDMAMQEPRSRIVRHESNRRIVAHISSIDRIPPHGVVVIINRAACASNGPERMAMQMERMRSSALSTNRWQSHFHNAIRWQRIHTPLREQILRRILPPEDLKQDGDSG